jgi:hypothetical protein
MRKLACLTLTVLASGGLAASTASAASATSFPTPCPVQPLVHVNANGSVTVTPPCAAEGKVSPITVTP